MASLLEAIGSMVDAVSNPDRLHFQSPGDNTMTPTSRDNFPLPREVRDKIYGLLLDADNVRVYSVNGDVHSYQFQTAILRVNRTIGEEAKRVLYASNTFIVVSYRWAPLTHDLKPTGVPVVSNHHLATFKESPLRIHLEWPKSKPSCRCCPPGDTPLESVLLVASDLPLFCRMLRIQNFRIVGDNTFVISARDEKPMRWHKGWDKTKTTTKIQFRRTMYGAASIQMQHALLQPFRSVLGTAHKVSILGEVDPDLAKEVSEAMMPKVAWAYAMGWNLLPLLRSWKNDADRTLEAGNLELAFEKYGFLVRVTETTIISKNASPTFIERCACCDWENGVDLLAFDCCVTCLLLALRLNQLEFAKHYIAKAMVGGMKLPHIDDTLVTRAFHISNIVLAEQGEHQGALEGLRIASSNFPSDRDIQQDLAKAEAYAKRALGSNRRRRAPPPLMYSNSSIACQPITVINTPFHGTPPDGLVGWKDTGHQLSKKDLKLLGLKASVH